MKIFKYEKPSFIMGKWCLFETPWFTKMYLILFKGWKRQIDGWGDSWIEHEAKVEDRFWRKVDK